ncbi:MAG TPA: TIGR02996 domain-containing protein, partial [Polyangiaceae bacterium]
MSAKDDLASAEAAVVVAALGAIAKAGTFDPALAETLLALTADARIHCEHRSYGPTYRPVACEAVLALVAMGPAAIPYLERATASPRVLLVPEPSYDQGSYIGDYTSNEIAIAKVAEDGIREVGKKHPGSIPWVETSREAWLALTDARVLMRATFDRKTQPLGAFVARAIVATARDVFGDSGLDVDSIAALELADAKAVVKPTCDEVACAVAALRANGSPAAKIGIIAFRRKIELADAFEALALFGDETATFVKNVKELVPFATSNGVPQVRLPRTTGSWAPLLAAVIAAPDDDAPRLAFADWMDARNDPRGAFVREQLAGTSSDTRAPWCRHDAAFFRRGFAAEALTANGISGAILAFAEEPTITRATFRARGDDVSYFFTSPAAPRVRELIVEGQTLYDADLERLFASNAFDLRSLSLIECSLSEKA